MNIPHELLVQINEAGTNTTKVNESLTFAMEQLRTARLTMGNVSKALAALTQADNANNAAGKAQAKIGEIVKQLGGSVPAGPAPDLPEAKQSLREYALTHSFPVAAIGELLEFAKDYPNLTHENVITMFNNRVTWKPPVTGPANPEPEGGIVARGDGTYVMQGAAGNLKRVNVANGISIEVTIPAHASNPEKGYVGVAEFDAVPDTKVVSISTARGDFSGDSSWMNQSNNATVFVGIEGFCSNPAGVALLKPGATYWVNIKGQGQAIIECHFPRW